MADPSPPDASEIALPTGDRAEDARALIRERRAALGRAVRRELGPLAAGEATRPESRSYLFEEACELYLNELSWEEITDEERVDDGALTEMVFPGLLAFLNALLPGDGAEGPQDHRDVVHDFLLWLAARRLTLREAEPVDGPERLRLRHEAAIADDLIDLVLALAYGLDEEEREAFLD